MKKLIALTALGLALTAHQAEAFTGGWSGGLNVAYAKATSKQHIKDTESNQYTYSGWAPVVTAEVKHSKVNCNTYHAVDGRLGWVFSKEKEEGNELKEGPLAGIGYRYGKIMNHSTLLFGRLGIDAAQHKFSYEFDNRRFKDTYWNYSFAPGVGIEWDIKEGLGVEILYQYSMTFATRGYNDQHHKFSKAPTAHHIGIGFSMNF